MELSGARKGSIAAHEMQHGVQGIEDMASGANSGIHFHPVSSLDEAKAYVSSLPREYGARVMTDPIDGRIGVRYQLSPDLYRRTAGEVEARNVETRLPMSAADRRSTAPWRTQDVPDDQQIVRFR